MSALTPAMTLSVLKKVMPVNGKPLPAVNKPTSVSTIAPPITSAPPMDGPKLNAPNFPLLAPNVYDNFTRHLLDWALAVQNTPALPLHPFFVMPKDCTIKALTFFEKQELVAYIISLTRGVPIATKSWIFEYIFSAVHQNAEEKTREVYELGLEK